LCEREQLLICTSNALLLEIHGLFDSSSPSDHPVFCQYGNEGICFLFQFQFCQIAGIDVSGAGIASGLSLEGE